MSEKIVIDSSVFISASGNPDIFTKESKKFFRKTSIQSIHVVIPSIVVAETLVKIYRHKKHIKRMREKLLEMEVIPLDSHFLEKFSYLIKKANLKTSDLIIAVCAKLEGATLITWDQRHLSKDNYLCPTLTPTQYLENLEN